MRWFEPINGDTKIKKKFAVFPIKINNETRWLEWTTIKYEYFKNKIIYDDGKYYRVNCWFPMEFIDENND